MTQLEQSRHDPEFRAQAAEIAARSGFDVDEVIAESLEIARHIAEIGEDAWDAECLAADRERADGIRRSTGTRSTPSGSPPGRSRGPGVIGTGIVR